MEKRSWIWHGLKRLLVLGMCVGLGFYLSMGADMPARAENGLEPEGAIIAPATVKPWLSRMETPTPFPAAEPTATATRLAATGEEDEPAAEDTALTEEQAESLLESANLNEDETVQDYLTLPEGFSARQDGVFSILLIGMDSHKEGRRGRSDAMILAQVNLKTGGVKLVSFLRDMYVKIPSQGMNRLNAAYYYGGAELLKKTLENNFGIQADGYVAIDFRAMINIVDQLGGVTLPVSEKERAQINKLIAEYTGKVDGQQLAAAGEQRLTGLQALCYSRIRKIDSDFQRAGRQHKVLEAMFSVLGQQDIGTLLGIATGCLDMAETDLSIQHLTALAPMLLSMESAAFETMQVPLNNAYQDDVVGGMMVLMPNLKKNAQAVAAFLGEE